MVDAGRLYAMEKGLVIPPKERTKMTNSLLVSLINQLEKVLRSPLLLSSSSLIRGKKQAVVNSNLALDLGHKTNERYQLV